jgi:hypothetical protein
MARSAINEAQAKSESDKNGAQELLETAKSQLERSGLLGYAGHDPTYTELKEEISKLQKQLKGGEETTSVFARLKEKLSGFMNRPRPPSTTKERKLLEAGRQPAMLAS